MSKASSRTDVHRVGAFVPADYSYRFSFSFASQVDGWPVPPVNIDEVIRLLALGAFARKPETGTNQCDVCGARYVHGDVWTHEPTGELITLGHECAEKYEMLAGREEWAQLRGKALAKAARAVRQRQASAAARSYLADRLHVLAALRLAHPILRDLARGLARYGSLTPAQEGLALKLAGDVVRKASEPQIPEAPVPAEWLNGSRVTIEGRVLATKAVESAYGVTEKMLVQVEVPGGACRLWGTVPSSFEGDVRGAVVRFAAKLKLGREESFALFSRPTKAEVVSAAPVVGAEVSS